MTVANLIEALKNYDPETRVLVDGYEGGRTDPHLRLSRVALNHNSDEYVGPHEEINEEWMYPEYFSDYDINEDDLVKALIISRRA